MSPKDRKKLLKEPDVVLMNNPEAVWIHRKGSLAYISKNLWEKYKAQGWEMAVTMQKEYRP